MQIANLKEARVWPKLLFVFAPGSSPPSFPSPRSGVAGKRALLRRPGKHRQESSFPRLQPKVRATQGEHYLLIKAPKTHKQVLKHSVLQRSGANTMHRTRTLVRISVRSKCFNFEVQLVNVIGPFLTVPGSRCGFHVPGWGCLSSRSTPSNRRASEIGVGC